MMQNSVPIVDDLSRMFPDIEGELCSRHSILFGKLKNTYNKIYDGMDPQHYTVVKGVLSLYQQPGVALSAALQNGVILLSSPIGPGESIYINGNHFDEEVIVSCRGEQEQGLHPLAEDIQAAVRLAVKEVEGEPQGAILYLHCNVPEDCFSYKEALLSSIYLAVSLINGKLATTPAEQMIKNMVAAGMFGSQQFVRQMFSYQNRLFTLRVGEESYKIPLEKDSKMVLCQLDLAKTDIQHQRKRREMLGERRNQILEVVKETVGLDSMLQVFENEQQVAGRLQFMEEEGVEQIMQGGSFLETSVRQMGLLSAFNSNSITFEQWVSAQWELNAKHWRTHAEEVVQLVEQMKGTLKINSCMIIDETFALMITDSRRYADLLVFLRQKLHKGELKSRSLFKIEEELVQHRWSSDKHIGEKMFTSAPSQGVAVFDPAQAIWFD